MKSLNYLKLITSTFVFFALFGLSQPALKACSCWGPYDFCSTMSEGGTPLLIVSAVKLSDYEHGMKIQILEVLAGTETRQNVTVWGDNGFLCRVYTGGFTIGDTLIMALGNAWSGFIEIESEDDYELSICGLHYLRQSGGMVSGNINGEMGSMPYADFVNNLDECLGVSTSAGGAAPVDWFPQMVQEPNGIKILPTPELEPLVFSLEIFDTSGKRLQYSETGQTYINTQYLSAGIYIIRLQTTKGILSRKVRIVR